MLRTPQACAAAIALACIPSIASATAQRTFVSSTGDDSHACSISAPCRGFAAAVAQTSANGEVIVLDSAGYGPVTISQSVSIIAPAGVYAGISVFSGQTGVTVILAASDKVRLRGLTLNGQGGSEGIVVSGTGELDVESCEIANLQDNGISSLDSTLRVVDTKIHSNANIGIEVNGGSVYLDNVEVFGNSQGLSVLDTSVLTVKRTRIHDQETQGAVVIGQGFTPSMLVTLADSDFSRNSTGLVITANPTAGSILMHVTIEGIRADTNSDTGIVIEGVAGVETIFATMRGSSASSNTNNGLSLGSATTLFMTISDCAINENGINGIGATGTSSTIIGLSGNTIARNLGHDIHLIAPAVIRTSINNAFTGDATDISGAPLTPNSLK